MHARKTEEESGVSLLQELLRALPVENASPERVQAAGYRVGRKMLMAGEVSYYDAESLSESLCDLKSRAGGVFSPIPSSNGILLKGCKCPFGERVEGNADLCEMTRTVFETIARQRFPESKAYILESLAKGDGRCLVRLDLAGPSG